MLWWSMTLSLPTWWTKSEGESHETPVLSTVRFGGPNRIQDGARRARLLHLLGPFAWRRAVRVRAVTPTGRNLSSSGPSLASTRSREARYAETRGHTTG